MSAVTFTKAAYEDIVVVGEAGERQFGRAASDIYLDELYAAFERLVHFRALGRLFPSGGETRVYVWRAHVIVYRPTLDGIEIVRVFHGRTDWLKALNPGEDEA